METKTLRQSITLSDLLAAVDSSNLRDLLKFQHNNGDGMDNEPRRQPPRNSVTLSSLIACEKTEPSVSVSCRDSHRAGRTLLDIIKDEQSTANHSPIARENDSSHDINWITFAERLRLRRAAENLAGAPATSEENVVRIERADTATPVSSEGQQPARVSLLALLEQTDRQWSSEDDGVASAAAFAARIVDGMDEEVSVPTAGGSVCCVCMVRQKGAAFIPCGHTFCRLCSRELWVNRGNCPLCNGHIVEILDIF